jgi:hypothetical protein
VQRPGQGAEPGAEREVLEPFPPQDAGGAGVEVDARARVLVRAGGGHRLRAPDLRPLPVVGPVVAGARGVQTELAPAGERGGGGRGEGVERRGRERGRRHRDDRRGPGPGPEAAERLAEGPEAEHQPAGREDDQRQGGPESERLVEREVEGAAAPVPGRRQGRPELAPLPRPGEDEAGGEEHHEGAGAGEHDPASGRPEDEARVEALDRAEERVAPGPRAEHAAGGGIEAHVRAEVEAEFRRRADRQAHLAQRGGRLDRAGVRQQAVQRERRGRGVAVPGLGMERPVEVRLEHEQRPAQRHHEQHEARGQAEPEVEAEEELALRGPHAGLRIGSGRRRTRRGRWPRSSSAGSRRS